MRVGVIFVSLAAEKGSVKPTLQQLQISTFTHAVCQVNIKSILQFVEFLSHGVPHFLQNLQRPTASK